MSENELSHRGLLKMMNAKLEYLLELRKIDRFVDANGESDEVRRYEAETAEKYSNRIRQIYAEDRKLNLN